MRPDLPNIVVRVAEMDDADTAAAVSRDAFARLRSIYRPIDEAVARQVARANEGTRLVAEFDEKIVGTVQFDVHRLHVHLIGLAVQPEFQRRGMARNMIEWVLAHTPTLGRTVVTLDTIKETGTVPLFEKLGFHVVSECVAAWCESDRFTELHDVKMERSVP